MRIYLMRENVVLDPSAADRARLEAIVADRNSPQKHVWRARIVLMTADRLGTVEVMRRSGKSQSPSPGPPIPTKLSPPSSAGSKR
jgi:hypothetical protein